MTFIKTFIIMRPLLIPLPVQENDWDVLALTLSAIKKRLCNAQFQTRRNLDSLTDQLVDLLFNTKRLEEFKDPSREFSVSDVKVCRRGFVGQPLQDISRSY